MQQITHDLSLHDPFLQQSCDLANKNNRDGAKFEIRPTLKGRAAVFLINGTYLAVKTNIYNTTFHKEEQ